MRQRVLKTQADLVGKPRGDAVAQSRGIVRFVRNHGHLARAQHDGNGDEPALAKDHVRLNLANQPPRLKITLDDAKWIDEVLPGEIPPELSRRDAVIGHGCDVRDQLFFNAVLGADVVHFPAFAQKRFHKRDIWRHVARGAAAGEDDSFRSGCLFGHSGCFSP